MSRILTASLATGPRPATLQRVVDAVLTWQERARQRHLLGALDDYLLHDMGLNRADVSREVAKPFWHA